MSKVTKNERISTLEDAVAMNWSDMKKIETKISRAMTDMATRISNISLQLEGQQRQIHLAADSIGLNKQAIIMLENKAEPKPQLKQLDQSVFNGLDEKWRFAAVDKNGECWTYTYRPAVVPVSGNWTGANKPVCFGEGYDTSNWQNSLIERDIAKELLEVDLSSELTGSDLARALKNRDEWVLVYVSDENDATAEFHQRPAIVTGATDDGRFKCGDTTWRYAVPINNQGEPLTQAEAGL